MGILGTLDTDEYEQSTTIEHNTETWRDEQHVSYQIPKVNLCAREG